MISFTIGEENKLLVYLGDHETADSAVISLRNLSYATEMVDEKGKPFTRFFQKNGDTLDIPMPLKDLFGNVPKFDINHRFAVRKLPENSYYENF